MPNLDFYAFDTDNQMVLEKVFELGRFRVFEASSEHDATLREFSVPSEIAIGAFGTRLRLYTINAGPLPTATRIDFTPGAVPGATFRYECEGWGLIQLDLGAFVRGSELRRSHTNHNTRARAEKWAGGGYGRLGDPGAWDFDEVARASSRLNRAIRAMAADKIGSHPVLPAAARLIAERGLTEEQGLGP